MKGFTTCKTCGCRIRQRRPIKQKIGVAMIAAALLIFASRYVMDVYLS